MNEHDFSQTLGYAVNKHEGQKRKGTEIPYITHAVIVSETIAYYYPDKPYLWQAALLHDIVEDTEVSAAELAESFGEEVARLVIAVSKDENKTHLPADNVARWKAEREQMLANIDGDSRDAVRLKAADALANMRAILRDLQNPEVGDRVWERFKVGKKESLWYYQEILNRVGDRLNGEPIHKELSYVLGDLLNGSVRSF